LRWLLNFIQVFKKWVLLLKYRYRKEEQDPFEQQVVAQRFEKGLDGETLKLLTNSETSIESQECQ